MKNIVNKLVMLPLIAGLGGALIGGEIANAQQTSLDKTNLLIVGGHLLMYSENPRVARLGELAHLYGLLTYQKELYGVSSPGRVGSRQSQPITTRTYIDNTGNRVEKSAITATGRIKKVWTELSVDGMSIHTKITVDGNMGWPTQLIAYFYNTWTGHGLEDSDGRYSTSDGKVCAGSEILIPPYMNTIYEEVSINIPWDQIELHSVTPHYSLFGNKARTDYNCKVVLLDYSQGYGRKLDESKRQHFGTER